MSDKPEMVTLTIDDKEVSVPRGTNLIEAASGAGIDIPYYCYHKHLSVAGNCRMCQVEVEGRPKLEIACNTGCQEGMVVRTQHTSEKTADTQRAVLEFLLINHPLDCTVCDQAGHCKLQDYYYEYNSKPSRFIEEKENKVKAEPLGPEVIYDGERCIMCTRCVRFCDEITETSELAGYNRGDKTYIGIDPSQQLDNPLSGSVVDLCPVGALTHRRWRFNTRIWYTEEKDSVCAGCSTGCNVKASVRDDSIVHVKGRLNSEVNQEWMCDEGRYGFNRFQPDTRLQQPLVRGESYLESASLDDALKAASKLKGGDAETSAVFLSPFLTLEEVWAGMQFAEKVMGLSADSGSIAMQLKTRELSEVEKVLISPDYAPNARAANLFGLGADSDDWRASLQSSYESLVAKLRSGSIKRLLLVGDFSLLDDELDDELINAILKVETSVALSPRGVLDGEEGDTDSRALGAHQLCGVILPSRTVNEKNGVMVTKEFRLQRLHALLSGPVGSYPDWMLLNRLAKAAGKKIAPESIIDDRAMFKEMVKQHSPFSGLTLMKLGELGMSWEELKQLQAQGSEGEAAHG